MLASAGLFISVSVHWNAGDDRAGAKRMRGSSPAFADNANRERQEMTEQERSGCEVHRLPFADNANRERQEMTEQERSGCEVHRLRSQIMRTAVEVRR